MHIFPAERRTTVADKQLTTYIALFHHRATMRLQRSAILRPPALRRGSLRVIGGGNGTSYSDSDGTFGAGYGYESQTGLAQIGVPDKDREHLADGLTQGGTVLVLEGAGDRADRESSASSASTPRKRSTKPMSTAVMLLPSPRQLLRVTSTRRLFRSPKKTSSSGSARSIVVASVFTAALSKSR